MNCKDVARTTSHTSINTAQTNKAWLGLTAGEWLQYIAWEHDKVVLLRDISVSSATTVQLVQAALRLGNCLSVASRTGC